MNDTRKPRATILSDDEFRHIWTASRNLAEVCERTGYRQDSAVRRASRLGLPGFHQVNRAVSHQIHTDRWERQPAASATPALGARQKSYAAYAAGIIDASGRFETVRAQSGILGHRLTVTVPKAANRSLETLSDIYGGSVASPLIGPGVRSATSVSWTIETSELYWLIKAIYEFTCRWQDEMYAAVIFFELPKL